MNYAETLNSESPNRAMEDWDLSPEDLRECFEDDSWSLHYEDYYDFDSDLLSSEDFFPTSQRTSTPWKAQHRKIPPLYIPKK